MPREQVLAAAGVKGAHDIEKSVRIVVTSGLVNQERFSKGLRESLEPRLKAVRPLFRATATGHAWRGGMMGFSSDCNSGVMSVLSMSTLGSCFGRHTATALSLCLMSATAL